MQIGQRIKRTQANIQECLTTPSSETARFRADTDLTWARGVILKTWEIEGFDPMFPIELVDVRWDDGSTMTVRQYLIETLCD